MALYNINNGRWCRYCAAKDLCDDEQCKMCLNKSFASHPKAAYWHPTKNGDLTPRTVSLNSHKKFWFICYCCKHDFDMALYHINNGRWCRYCAGQDLCDDEQCKMCLNKSFASHPKAECWHPTKNGDLTPRTVSLNSSKKFWFICYCCKHDFDMALYSINNGRWCRYCAGQDLCDDEQCKMCLNKSFASHPKAAYWHPTKNGDLTPRTVSLNSHKKFWFICYCCKNDFDMALYSINNGQWCPICCNKTEKKLFEFLKNKFPDTAKRNIRYDWCKNPDTHRYLPFDFEVFVLIIIELDGRQHFIQISNWSGPEDQQERDMYKMTQAINNGKHVIRILQEDVWNDKNNWEEKLVQAILRLKDDPDTKIICIGECNVYNKYRVELED